MYILIYFTIGTALVSSRRYIYQSVCPLIITGCLLMIEVNKENYDREIKQSKIPVIIDFWAEWCGPCRMMGPVFEELGSEYEGRLKFVKINTELSPEIAGRFEIHGIPCLVLVKDGKEIDRITGFAPASIMRGKIDDILSRI